VYHIKIFQSKISVSSPFPRNFFFYFMLLRVFIGTLLVIYLTVKPYCMVSKRQPKLNVKSKLQKFIKDMY